MGRYYSVFFAAQAITAAVDLFELIAPANAAARIRLHEVGIIQTSDVASADSEVLRVEISRFTSASTSGSGGASATPSPLESGDGAATFTAETYNTTQVTGGTETKLFETGFNVLAGFQWSPMIPPDRKPSAVNSERLVVKMTAPADSLTISAYAIVEEG